jgi:hypothetical protein
VTATAIGTAGPSVASRRDGAENHSGGVGVKDFCPRRQTCAPPPTPGRSRAAPAPLTSSSGPGATVAEPVGTYDGPNAADPQRGFKPEHLLASYALMELGDVLTMTSETNSNKLWDWKPRQQAAAAKQSAEHSTCAQHPQNILPNAAQNEPTL